MLRKAIQAGVQDDKIIEFQHDNNIIIFILKKLIESLKFQSSNLPTGRQVLNYLVDVAASLSPFT